MAKMWNSLRKNALTKLRQAGVPIAEIQSDPEAVEAKLIELSYSRRSAGRLARFFGERTPYALYTQQKLLGIGDAERSERISRGKRQHVMDQEHHRVFIRFIVQRSKQIPPDLIADAWNEVHGGQEGFAVVSESAVGRWLYKVGKHPTRAELWAMPAVKERNREKMEAKGRQQEEKSDKAYALNLAAQRERIHAILAAAPETITQPCLECGDDVPFTEEFWGERLDPMAVRCELCRKHHRRKLDRLKRSGCDRSALAVVGREERKRREQTKWENLIPDLFAERDELLAIADTPRIPCSNCEHDTPDDDRFIVHRPARPKICHGVLCVICNLGRIRLNREVRKLVEAGEWNREAAISVRSRYAELFRLTPRRKCRACKTFFPASGRFFKRPKKDTTCVFCR